MDSRTEKKIEKQLDIADKHHDKAAIAQAKGHLGSADRHEHTAMKHEGRAETLAHTSGSAAGGAQPYTGLNYPYTGATAHPTYGYHRLPRDKKAERFELKAIEWEKKGNTTKAQKNREKALRHRQRMIPGYVPTRQPQQYYTDKANRFDQRAVRYEQLGLAPQSHRYRQRALRTRSKHGLPAPVVNTNMGTATGYTGATGLQSQGTTGFSGVQQGTTGYSQSQGGYNNGAYVGPIVPMGTVYKGLNHPHTGATQHSTFGYSKLTSSQKAARFDTKAAEWEKRGDLVKAQKNRDKANRYRQMNQAGYVKPTRAQSYYMERAAKFDQKAIRNQQLGRSNQALRAQQRAQRIRTKHNLPASTAGAGGFGAYQGLNFPYSSSTAHPTYGYQRLPVNKKAERFEAKAAEWERRGNLKKAQKNREKAQRYRSRSQPGYAAPVRSQTYYVDRANLYDQKSLQYQQWGMAPQSQRYQGRSQRIRTKRNIAPAPAIATTTVLTSAATPYNMNSTYQGLNFPYNNTQAHPSYGYQRLPRDRKAERFEAKAAEWERRGNLKKATKNREKALRIRQKSQPNYVAQPRPTGFYQNRATLYDQKAVQYQQVIITSILLCVFTLTNFIISGECNHKQQDTNKDPKL